MTKVCWRVCVYLLISHLPIPSLPHPTQTLHPSLHALLQQPEAVTILQFRNIWKYSKTCLKRNAIVPVFFFSFSQVSVLQKVVF
jgi:hypothetical protein